MGKRRAERCAGEPLRVPLRASGYAAATLSSLSEDLTSNTAVSTTTIVCRTEDAGGIEVDGEHAWSVGADGGRCAVDLFELRRVDLYFDDPQEDADDTFAEVLAEMLYPGLDVHYAVQQALPGSVQRLVDVWVELDWVDSGGDDEQEQQQQQQRATLFSLFEHSSSNMTVHEVDRFRRALLDSVADEGRTSTTAAEGANAATTAVRWSDAELMALLRFSAEILRVVAEAEESRARRRGEASCRFPLFGAKNVVCLGTERYEEECEEVLRGSNANPNAVTLPRLQKFAITADAFTGMGAGDASTARCWSPLVPKLRPAADVFSQHSQGMTFVMGCMLLELALAVPAGAFDPQCTEWRSFVQLRSEPTATPANPMVPPSPSLFPLIAETGRFAYNPVLRALLVQSVHKDVSQRPTPAQILTALSMSSKEAAAWAEDSEAEKRVVIPHAKPRASPATVRAVRCEAGVQRSLRDQSGSSVAAPPLSGPPPREPRPGGKCRRHDVARFRDSRRRMISVALSTVLKNTTAAEVPRDPRFVGAHAAFYTPRAMLQLRRRDSLMSHRSNTTTTATAVSTAAARCSQPQRSASLPPTPRGPHPPVRSALLTARGGGGKRRSTRIACVPDATAPEPQSALALEMAAASL